MIPARLSKPIAVPKPSARLADRIAYKKAQDEKGRRFRAQVWTRDQHRCKVCHKVVKRTTGLDPLRGEVHHVRGRNVTPEDRFNVEAAVLVCLSCHLRLTRREIFWPPR